MHSVVEIRQLQALELLVQQVFDAGDQALVLGRDQRPGHAFGLDTGRAADAVHVVLRLLRHVVVDDMRDAVDVQATGGDVGRHQNVDLPAAEGFQGPQAVALVEIAMDDGHRQALLRQLARHDVGFLPRAGEHQGAGDRLLAQKLP